MLFAPKLNCLVYLNFELGSLQGRAHWLNEWPHAGALSGKSLI